MRNFTHVFIRNPMLILVAVVCFTACDSEEEKLMWYTDVEPDLTITSMIPFPWTFDDYARNSLIYATRDEGHGDIVASAHALYYHDLDLDGFSEYDFNIMHAYLESGLPNEEFVMHIGSHRSNLISLSDPVAGYVKTYARGDAPDYASFGAVPVYPGSEYNVGYLVRRDAAHQFETNGEFYLALNVKIKQKSHYGWMRVAVESASLTLTVKDFALCRIPDREITMGQLK